MTIKIMELEISKILDKKGIKYRLIELEREAFTVDDVINFSKGDINPEEICKTIILRGKKTNKKSAVLLKGNDRLNFPEVKKLFGEEMTIANNEEVKEIGGVDPGAVCPFLLNVPLYVDKRVLDLQKINCGSGHHLFGLEFSSVDLNKGVFYQVADLAKEKPLK